MKHILMFFMLILTINTYSQKDNYNRGYQEGYKQGYCYEKGVGCIAPIPPNSPIPKVSENQNSYQDGYNRGFNDGLQAQKKESNNNSQDRKRYETAQPQFKNDFIYQPPWDLIQKVLEQKQLKYDNTKEQRELLFNQFFEYANSEFVSGNYNMAVEYGKYALSMGFYNDDIYIIIGVSYYKLGKYNLANEYLRQVKSSQIAIHYLELINKTGIERVANSGIKIGYNYNTILPSLTGGLFFEFNGNKTGFIFEFMYQNSSYLISDYDEISNSYSTTGSYKYVDNLLLTNLLLKTKIIKNLGVIYGTGITFGFNSANMYLDANLGLQYKISHKFFAETRFNKDVLNIIGNYSKKHKDIFPDYNLQINIGYKFY